MKTNLTKLQADLAEHIATLKADAAATDAGGLTPLLSFALSGLTGAKEAVDGHLKNTAPETRNPKPGK